MRKLFLIVAACFGTFLVQANRGLSAEPLPDSVEYFETHVRPVLAQHCYACHSSKSKKIEGGLVLDTAIGWQSGGDSGPALIPGEPDQSLLVAAMKYEGIEMPPEGRLSDDVVAKIEAWVKAGANDPRSGDLPESLRRSINLEEGKKFWAFQPPVPRPIPESNAASASADGQRVASRVDAFLDIERRAREIPLAPEASPDVALRRLSFDLTGLPPDPEVVRAYVADPSRQHWSRIVDQYLASPEFAEHWGRHWLDVARYADSNGSDFNATFHHAWRYRNWVVQAVARDLPVDQFIRMQVAGDLMPFADDAQRADQLVATSFLMIGPKMLSERNKDKLRMDVVDEQIDTIGKTFMGLTLGCARCHDHKFDPIPTEDYYALAGIFRSTRTLQGESQKYVSAWKDTLLPVAQARIDEVTAHQKRATEFDKEIKRLTKEIETAKKATTEDQGVNEQLGTLEAKLKETQESLKAHKETAPEPLPMAFAAQDMDTTAIGNAFVCIRGEVENEGAHVERGFLQVCSLEAPPMPTASSGRLELADWLTHPRHPLVSRVYVNRVWMLLFGEGLVRTLDNFGIQGETPSHPELLDHLALEFMEQGWSLKQLVRRLACSDAYRLSCELNPAAEAKDPENRYLWRAHRKRVPAEGLRDTLVQAAGLLSRTPSVNVMQSFGTLVDQNVSSTSVSVARTTRRTVYEPVIRNYVSPLLVAFDFADPDLIVPQRPTTNVPAQALVLLNSPEVLEYVKKIHARMLQGTSDSSTERTEWIYLQLLGRHPSTEEMELASQSLGAHPIDSDWQSLIHALVASTAFRLLD